MKKIKRVLLALSVCLVCAICGVAVGCGGSGSVKYTFDVMGGAAIESVEVESGTQYTLPVPSDRSGYSFDGWYLSNDFSGSPVTSVTATESQTYYAKWTKLIAIQLELNGGTLSDTQLYLKEGANVFSFMQDYVPTKSGYVFGAWFVGNAELSKNLKMPQEGLTLTAKYKVAYTVKIWTEKLDGDGYENVEEDVIGYAYAGTSFTSECPLKGFKDVTPASDITRVLSENASENVFEHYLDRETYTVRFNPNYPNGTDGETDTLQVKYGKEISVYSDYTCDGYCLLGWATSKTGSLLYEANYINQILYNGEDEDKKEADTFSPDRNLALYGVWVKGYTDMFGGNDSVFVLNEADEVAYLLRGPKMFKGTYNAEEKSFRFRTESRAIVGRVNEDGTFTFYSSTRVGTYELYKDGQIDKNVTLIFDAYNGFSYYEKKGDGTTESSGSYTLQDEYVVATFTAGDETLVGKTAYIYATTMNLNDKEYNVFRIRNDEDCALGKLERFEVVGSELKEVSGSTLTLNGFGYATYASESYSYTREGDRITLKEGGKADIVLLLKTVGEKTGYAVYESELDGAFSVTGGGTLTLDGAYNATFENGGSSVSGYYVKKASLLGGEIVKFTSGAQTYAFLLTKENEESAYTAEQKHAEYAEYYYMNETSSYYAPLLVVNEPSAGEATVYGYTNGREHKKVSCGTLTLNTETGLYVYEAKTYTGETVLTNPFDLSQVKSFVCALDDTMTAYNIHYWYSWTDQDETTENFKGTYTSDKNGTLTLVSGFAFYSDGGLTLSGIYSGEDLESGIVTIRTKQGNLYVEIDGDKFVTLQSKPENVYRYEADGSITRSVYLATDGKGNATYTVATLNVESGAISTVEYVGTVVKTDKKINVSDTQTTDLYRFTSQELTFEYLPLYSATESYFLPYNETYNGRYTEKNDRGILSLDGFGYRAVYTDENGTDRAGRYFIYEEKSLLEIRFDDGVRYFDLLADKKFTLRGAEYGEYILIENQTNKGLYFEMDGYGTLSVFKIADGERTYVDQNGKYAQNGTTFTLSYSENGKAVTLIGSCGLIKENGTTYNTFIASNASAAQTFVNKTDWSILILDDLGNATKYTADGLREYGSYTLVTSTLLYYVNNAGDDGCIYVYDREDGTATPIRYEERGYYTENLESLLFSKTGFSIFNGETNYYYNVENDEVVLYRKAVDGDQNVNEYGFVEDRSFGSFEDEKTYNGKTYYLNNDLAIRFTRGEEGDAVNDYPILVSSNPDVRKPLAALSFLPSGKEEFAVVGQVVIGNNTYNCYVVREIVNGAYETYVLMNAGMGNYRFDVEISYGGSSRDSVSTYKITQMRWIVDAFSYQYLDTYYSYYTLDLFFGTSYLSTYQNNIGKLAICHVYDKQGLHVESENYLTGEFLEDSKMYNLNGEIVAFEKAALTADGSSYIARFEDPSDGYTYSIYFYLTRHEQLDEYGYVMTAFTREQTLDAGDGYKVIVERILASETTKSGGVYSDSVRLQKPNGEVLKFRGFTTVNDTRYYMDRVTDEDDKDLSATYYHFAFKDSSSGEIQSTTYGLYDSVTMQIEDVAVYYSQDGAWKVDIGENLGVTIAIGGKNGINIVKECSYDEATDTYTAVCDYATLKVKIEDGFVTVVEE